MNLGMRTCFVHNLGCLAHDIQQIGVSALPN